MAIAVSTNLDPDCRCGDGRWSHKRGSGGCRVMDCPCDKYEPPKGKPAPAAEPVTVAEPEPEHFAYPDGTCAPDCPGCGPAEVRDLADIVDAGLAPVAELMESGQPEPTCAYPNGEDAGEHDHAMCEDVVAERAELERLRGVDAALGRAQEQVDRLSGQLQARLADLDEERREHQATGAIVTRLREELDRANAGRQKAQDALDEALRTGLAAATQVLGRYEAHACLECGARYGQPFTDHGCGPLVPVVVTIARRQVPGA